MPGLPIKREDELEVRELPNDERFVYDRQKGVTHHLSNTTTFVWERCDGKTRPSDLARIVRSELKDPGARDTVRKAIDRLDRLQLIRR